MLGRAITMMMMPLVVAAVMMTTMKKKMLWTMMMKTKRKRYAKMWINAAIFCLSIPHGFFAHTFVVVVVVFLVGGVGNSRASSSRAVSV